MRELWHSSTQSQTPDQFFDGTSPNLAKKKKDLANSYELRRM